MLKTAFFVGFFFAKCANELHPLSISDSCSRWNLDCTRITLCLNKVFISKILSCTHLNQPIWLAQYGHTTLQLLQAFGELPTSFSVMVDLTSIVMSPNKVWPTELLTSSPMHAHKQITVSLRLVWGALRATLGGLSQEDICATSWVLLDMFSRFYRVNMATPNLLPLVTIGLWLYTV